MGCARGFCVPQSVFIFINIAFAMYSGALLSTAARLAWDPSTYTWFRFLCVAQYHASLAYVLAAGLWLAALVYLAAAIAHRPNVAALHTYAAGMLALALSEVVYGVWMVVSLMEWWKSAPEAELARKGLDLIHDVKPALLAVERYKDVTMPIYEMMEEVEQRAPNNIFVVIVFALLAIVLQIVAVVVARRLASGVRTTAVEARTGKGEGNSSASEEDSDSEALEKTAPAQTPPPGWHKSANLRMKRMSRPLVKVGLVLKGSRVWRPVVTQGRGSAGVAAAAEGTFELVTSEGLCHWLVERETRAGTLCTHSLPRREHDRLRLQPYSSSTLTYRG
ncbi:unnamed protein product [Leptosia nina]|uniref:Uncharacterized protein n=1 Tax=Leptosia nina TaxID=320188 RepID=A0AAV1J0P7_9NEOP